MIDKGSFLLKNFALFFIASFLPKTISFFLVPLYTSCLTTAEYGTADLLINIVSLCVPILTLVIQDAVLRFVLDNHFDKKNIFTVGMKITISGTILLTLGCVLLKATKILYIDYFYIIFIILNYTLAALVETTSYFCRGINKISILTFASIAQTFVTVVANLVFLLYLKWALNGYLFAILLGYMVNFIIVFIGAKLYRYVNMRYRCRGLEKQMIKFSAPLIICSLSWWINNASDKYILTYLCGLSIVGIYSVAYKIPTILSVLGTVISKAFTISAIKEIDIKDTDGFLGKSYSLISYTMTIGCAFLIVFNTFLSRALFAKEFFIAWKYVPPLLIAFLMSSISGACQSMLTALNKTVMISVTAIIGAFANIILNIVLIPLLEGYGAALATMVSFWINWVARYVYLKKCVKLKNNITKEVTAYFLVMAEMVLAFWGNKYIIFEILIIIILLMLYYKEEKEMVRKAKDIIKKA